jgi:hypothetical protein
MFKFIGVLFGLVGLSFLIQGAFVAFAKVNPESADTLLIGLSLLLVAQFFMGIGTHNGKDSNTQPTLPESKV